MKCLLKMGLFLMGANAFAQGTTPTSPPPSKEVNPPPPVSCHEYLSNPPGGEIVYDPQSRRAFLLSYVGDRENHGDDWANVIAVDLKKKEGTARAAFQLNRASTLVGHYRPMSSLTIFTFNEDRDGCNVGAGNGVSFSLQDKPTLQRTFPQQEYELMRTDSGLGFVDRKNNLIREVDLATMQRKVGRKVPKDRVLFWSEKDLHLIAFEVGKDKILYRMNVANGKRESEVRLRAEQEVLQDDDDFSFVERFPKENYLTVQQVPRWSSANRPLTQKLVLPAEYPVANAAMTWDSSRGRVLMWGKFPLRTRQWDRTFLFTMDREKPVVTFDVPKNQYVSSAILIEGEPLFLLKNKDTQNISALMLRDKKSGRFEAIRLLLKERPGQKVDLKADSPTGPASPQEAGK